MKNYTKEHGRCNRQEFVIRAAIEIMAASQSFYSDDEETAERAWELAESLLETMPEEYRK